MLSGYMRSMSGLIVSLFASFCPFFKSLDLSSQFFDDWSHVLGDGIFQVVFLMIGVMFWMMGYFKSFFG